MSTVGAFAAYGPLSAIGFPAFVSRNRPSSSGIGDSRPEAAEQSRDRPERLPLSSQAPKSADGSTRALPPIDPVIAAERDRLEPTLIGFRAPINDPTVDASFEETERLYDPQEELEAQSKRIADQVDRFEELLRRLNEYRDLTAPATGEDPLDAESVKALFENEEKNANSAVDLTRFGLEPQRKNGLDRDTRTRLNVVL